MEGPQGPMIDRQSANSSLGIVNRRQLTKRGPLLDRCPLRLFAKVLWVLVCGHGHNLVAKTKLLGSLAIVAVWFPLVTLDASPATCEAACPRSSLFAACSPMHCSGRAPGSIPGCLVEAFAGTHLQQACRNFVEPWWAPKVGDRRCSHTDSPCVV